MPIFSTYHVYKHYLTVDQWNRATQLPSVISFFERCLDAHKLVAKIGLYLHPEFAVWATSCPGTKTSKKSYETLETYGDTILKLAATMLAYQKLEKDNRTDEKRMNDMKNQFITNLNLFRLGSRLKLREFIRMKDPDPKKWDPAFSIQSINSEEFLNCTGKNIADMVESLLGAVFLSNNLHVTLRFISDIELVPMV
jgi:dsRNA-specific ribonuclease